MQSFVDKCSMATCLSFDDLEAKLEYQDISGV